MTKRTEQKDLFLAALRGDAAAQRTCTKAGKPCGGRCIPKHWNCRIKGEGLTPPTRGNSVQLSTAQKEKIQKARRQRRIKTGLKAAGTLAAIAGAASVGAGIARKNPQAMRRAAAKAGLGANFAGMASNIPGPVGAASGVVNLGLGAFQAGATAGASLGSNRAGVKRLGQLKSAIAARDKVIGRTNARIRDLTSTRSAFEVERTNLLGRMGDSGSKAQQRTLKSLSTAINKKNGEIATAGAKLTALQRRNASLTRGTKKIEGLLGGQYNTAEKIYKGVEQTNNRFRAGRRQTAAMRPKGRTGPKKDPRSWQERFNDLTKDEAERADKKCGNSGSPDNAKCTKAAGSGGPTINAKGGYAKFLKEKGVNPGDVGANSKKAEKLATEYSKTKSGKAEGKKQAADYKKYEEGRRKSGRRALAGAAALGAGAGLALALARRKPKLRGSKPNARKEAYVKAQMELMRRKGTGKYGARSRRKTGGSFRPDIEAMQGDAEGKKYSKTVTDPKTGRKRTVKYGAKGYTIAPGTKRGNSYCARSFGDMKSHNKNCAGKDRNTPLCLSRAKWKCSGKTSR